MFRRQLRKEPFAEMFDPTVLDWPVEEALSLAKLALQSCELRKRDSPDLDSVCVAIAEPPKGSCVGT